MSDDNDIKAFKDAVAEVVNGGSGDAAVAAYADLEPRAGKSAGRAHLDDTTREVVLEGNLEAAQRLFALKDALSARPSGGSSIQRLTPTEAHIELVQGIQLGYALAVGHPGAGVDADWGDKLTQPDDELVKIAAEYREWLASGQMGQEPSATKVAKAAARISLGRGPKGQGRRPNSKAATTTLAEASTPAAEVNGEPVPADVNAGAGVPDASSVPDGWPA